MTALEVGPDAGTGDVPASGAPSPAPSATATALGGDREATTAAADHPAATTADRSGAPSMAGGVAPRPGAAAEIGLQLANRAIAFVTNAAAQYATGLGIGMRGCCPTTQGAEHMVQCPGWRPPLTVEEIAHLRETVLKGVVSS